MVITNSTKGVYYLENIRFHIPSYFITVKRGSNMTQQDAKKVLRSAGFLSVCEGGWNSYNNIFLQSVGARY